MQEKRPLRHRRPTVTLAKVARLANVSEITVSRIMRNKGPIADQTRARVMEAVQAVGYVPNRVAGSLASADSNLMGVIIPSLSNIVFPEVLRGVHDALDESGFQPVVGVTNYDLQSEESLVRALLAWKPAAMIIVGFDHTDATRRMLQDSGVRVAELMDIDSPPIDIAVGLSHRRAGYDSGKYLIGRGYRRFGYVGHDWSLDRRARLRYDGLVAALAERGLSIAAEARVAGPSSTLAGRAMLADLLARSPGIDVAVFSNDDMAVGGVFHCIASNIRLKDELAVFGFNGLEIGQSLPTPLSTIRSNRYLIGRIGVERIAESPYRGATPLVIDAGYELVSGATA
ncbi:MAG: LacI family DNA-binding transcriptional regulator [Roseiarcus sp.]|jgi:LacI family gluconate utilization system Gnt-I transcriptional repressor